MRLTDIQNEFGFAVSTASEQTAAVQFNNWMSKNGLTRESVLQLLLSNNAIDGFIERDRIGAEPTGLDLNRCIFLVASALSQTLDVGSASISKLFDTFELETIDDPKVRPVTLFNRETSQITIKQNFRGTAKCVLDLAHELGHGLQLRLAASPLSPVLRECGALIAEQEMVKYLSEISHHSTTSVSAEYKARCFIYKVVHGNALSAALHSPVGYNEYDWNYPIASFIVDHCDHATRIEIFHGRAELKRILKRISRKPAESACLPLPSFEEQSISSGLCIYEKIGAKFMLDYRGCSADQSLSVVDYVQDAINEIKTDGLEIYFSDFHQPTGYTASKNKSAQRTVWPIASRLQSTFNKRTSGGRLYRSIGQILYLLAHSQYHSKQCTIAYVRNEILPALNSGQCVIYANDSGRPIGFVSWALLSEKVASEVASTGRGVNEDEWISGRHLYINDFVAPFGNARRIATDVKQHRLSAHNAFGIRRYHSKNTERLSKFSWTQHE